jgi:UPF0271 protein
MKLNADLGERVNGKLLGMDAELMPLLDQANIACGVHAGDLKTMRDTVRLAKEYGVEVGAHPSYPDPENFGRTSMTLPREALIEVITHQVDTLSQIAEEEQYPIHYVKPHGALYNDMMADRELFSTVLEAINRCSEPLRLMLLANDKHPEFSALADRKKIELIFEAFADRAYTDHGQLVSRSHAHAVHSEADAINQVRRLVEEGVILSENGHPLIFPVDSICVHGDNPEALRVVQQIRALI